MMFVRYPLQIADYAVKFLAVVFALLTLWAWYDAVFVWGDSYAYAEALTWTALTAVVLLVGWGVNYLRNRGE